MEKKSVAVITARGGSKRIPKKNIKDFCGKPVIAYSIEAAVGAACFDEVMVSTDSGEIADAAVKYGASVPFMRSGRTAGDYATTADVMEEVLSEYEKRGKQFDTFCCIYPTAPFVSGEMLARAMGQYVSAGADAVVAVVPYSFPPQRAFVIRDGHVRYRHPENERVRSQDLERLYHDCGQFYICGTKTFRRCHTLILPGALPFVMPENEVQDIDTEEDWRLAEIKYIAKNCRERSGKDMMEHLFRDSGGYDRGLKPARRTGSSHSVLPGGIHAAGKAVA